MYGVIRSKLRACCVFLLLAISTPVMATTTDTRLDRLMADYWDGVMAVHPMAWALMGDVRHRDRVDDLSDSGLAVMLQGIDDALARLGSIPPDELSPGHRIHYETFDWMLRKERVIQASQLRFFTFNTVGGWHDGFAQVIAGIPYNTEQDYRDLQQRLQQRLQGFSDYVDQNIALMESGIATGYTQPCEVLTGYEDTIEGYVSDKPEHSVLYQPFLAMPGNISAQTAASLQKEAREVIDEIINPGYRRYADFFRQTYRPACRHDIALSSLPGGADLYQYLLRFYTSLDTDAETVHGLGLDEVARIRKEMLAVLDEDGFEGSLADFFEFLKTSPEFYVDDEQSYLNHVAWIAKSIEAQLPRYFARLPSATYGVKAVPAQIAPKTATAYYQAGAADGTSAGQYFVNTYKLDSRPLFELPALSLHEGVPGHHLQLAFQGENTSMPQWRRIYYFHAFGEGWGLYSEFLGQEMGIYTTPYERFGRMSYEMWRAVRLVVDTGIHVKGWSRQQAIDYVLANTALTEQNVVAEIDRYITYPGQATAYKHGELKIRELRRHAEQALGERFDLRQFHVAVVAEGSLPLTVLEAKIERWIAGELSP